jgi:hypothetical protein
MRRDLANLIQIQGRINRAAAVMFFWGILSGALLLLHLFTGVPNLYGFGVASLTAGTLLLLLCAFGLRRKSRTAAVVLSVGFLADIAAKLLMLGPSHVLFDVLMAYFVISGCYAVLQHRRVSAAAEPSVAADVGAW